MERHCLKNYADSVIPKSKFSCSEKMTFSLSSLFICFTVFVHQPQIHEFSKQFGSQQTLKIVVILSLTGVTQFYYYRRYHLSSIAFTRNKRKCLK